MIAKIFSAALVGIDAREVEIEVNESGGNPKMVVVGLPDTAVRESRDRVLTAVANSGFITPRGHTTVNLAPADLKKEGPSFDLPMALGVIALRENLTERLPPYTIVGELALDGKIRSVKGCLSIALEARNCGKDAVIVPKMNAREACQISGIDVFGVSTLREAYEIIAGLTEPLPARPGDFTDEETEDLYDIDLSEVRGQAHVKRALEVSVAGGHNLLMIGPPGTGKSMLAKRMVTIMPPLSETESIELTKIHSICGLLDTERGFLRTRPFRSPHHTISDVGLLGGSSNPSPGEISLAHHGILFLDELPEFRRSTLEVMRQPLEDGKVTITRAAGTITFPARFMLVAAMNPCPCGYHGDPKRECRCSPLQIQRYRQRISGPLLDRIDLHIDVPLIDYKELSSNQPAEPSSSVRHRVRAARLVQEERFKDNPKVACNSSMQSRQLRQHCQLNDEGNAYLDQAMSDFHLSARAFDRILKVARTLADLEGATQIESSHVLESIQYRTLDRNLWG